MEEESEVEFTETVGVDSNIVTGAVASGEGDTVVAAELLLFGSEGVLKIFPQRISESVS